jgi:hypothetical protein
VTDAIHNEVKDYDNNADSKYWKYARYAHYVMQVISSTPVNEELWSRILDDPQAAFIGLRDAGIVKGKNLELRRYERITTKDTDVLLVQYFLYPDDLESLNV